MDANIWHALISVNEVRKVDSNNKKNYTIQITSFRSLRRANIYFSDMHESKFDVWFSDLL